MAFRSLRPAGWLRRGRRPAGIPKGPGALSRLRRRLGQGQPWRRLEVAGLVASVLGCVHLAAVALLPGGHNRVFDWSAPSPLAYLTLLPAPQALGFPPRAGRGGFLLYKLYAQNGQILDGSFPDARVRPRLRYDRWALAGEIATADVPALHSSIVAYQVSQLPDPPLRVEMYAADWEWDHNKYEFPWRGFNHDSALELRLLGSYNGLTQEWTPAPKGSQ